MDKIIALKILKYDRKVGTYSEFFYPEIKPFITQNDIFRIKKRLPQDYNQNFDHKRKNGQNEDHVCELIRNDSIDEFQQLYQNGKISRWSDVNHSIFETNPFLLKKQDLSLIEYAAFYGSIKIFNFLHHEGVSLNESMWKYSVQGGSLDIIQQLHKNRIEINQNDCLNQSINCFNNEVADFILDNYYTNDDERSFNSTKFSIESYNFKFLKKEFINRDALFELCRYDYICLIEPILLMSGININQKEI